MIKVSIIVAAYNVEKYIERCMDSLINQTLYDIEIIVVNDGSTDSTLNILKRYNERDNRIIIVDKKNAGLIEARKSGLVEAKGEYLIFVDGDDWIDINTAEILYNKAKKDKLDIVCYNLCHAYDTWIKSMDMYDFGIATDLEYLKLVLLNKVRANIVLQFLNRQFLCHAYDTWIKSMDMYDFGIATDLEYLKLVLLNKVRANIVLQFLNRQFVINNNIEFPSNITYAEDLAITATLACNKPKAGSLYETLYYYYQRENSVTQQVSEKVFDVEIAINIIEETLKSKGLYEEYYNEFQYLMFIHLYYHRIIAVRYLGKIHKELYNRWVSKRVSKGLYEEYYNEFQYLMFIHLYYHRIIAVRYLGKIHKELYNRWVSKRVNLKTNEYYRGFIKTIPFKERLKIELYNINYNLGNMYNHIYNFMIELLRK